MIWNSKKLSKNISNEWEKIMRKDFKKLIKVIYLVIFKFTTVNHWFFLVNTIFVWFILILIFFFAIATIYRQQLCYRNTTCAHKYQFIRLELLLWFKRDSTFKYLCISLMFIEFFSVCFLSVIMPRCSSCVFFAVTFHQLHTA